MYSLCTLIILLKHIFTFIFYLFTFTLWHTSLYLCHFVHQFTKSVHQLILDFQKTHQKNLCKIDISLSLRGFSFLLKLKEGETRRLSPACRLRKFLQNDHKFNICYFLCPVNISQHFFFIIYGQKTYIHGQNQHTLILIAIIITKESMSKATFAIKLFFCYSLFN